MTEALKILYEANNLGIWLWVQGDALKFRSPENTDVSAMLEQLKQHKQEIVGILKDNGITTEKSLYPRMYRTVAATGVLSFAQARLWFIEQYEKGTSVYHAPALYELPADVDADAITYAIRQVAERHEVFRSTIGRNAAGDQDMLIIHDAPLQVRTCNISSDEDPAAVIKQEIGRPFDLSNEYPLRVILYTVQREQKRLLLINMHHIASDGWSVELLQEELKAYYDAFLRKDTTFSLPPLTVQYKDYALWQRHYLSGRMLQEQLSYWKGKLEGYRPLQLPADYQRPAVVDYKGAQHAFRISAATGNKLRALAQANGVTLYSVMLGSLNILLGKYTGQDDIVIGTPIANRSQRQSKELIGFFVNIQAQRTLLSASQDFNALVQQVHQAQKEAQLYQELPFEKLVSELGEERDLSRHPVFQVILEVQSFGDMDTSKEEKPLLRPYRIEDGQEAEKFDLSFFINDGREEISGVLSYASSLFKPETVAALARHYVSLLDQLAASPGAPYSGISLLSPQEQQQLAAFNDIPPNYDGAYTSVISLFRQQAHALPDAPALVFEGSTVSYKQLDEQSDRLAAHLHTAYQLGKGGMAGIMLDRSDKMIVAILAVLKAGAAYVPVDTAYPADRKARIIGSAGIAVLLTQTDYIFDLDYYQGPVFAVDIQLDGIADAAAPAVSADADDRAYVIFTSGSTGQPKGCSILHRNLSHYTRWANNYYFDAPEQGNFGLYTSLSFDLTVTSIFCALTRGKCLTVYPQQEELLSILRHSFSKGSGVDTIKLTPSHIRLLEPLQLHSTAIGRAIVGGEAISSQHVRILKAINPEMRVFNEYGPTETTVGCVVKELQPDEPVLIGRPAYGTRIYILGPSQELLPPGIAGEIWIAGSSVGEGYLNQPALTAERFVPDPLQPGHAMYRTGDLGRWLENGEIDYLGRKDDQVKIQGYRIELGDVENALLQVPGILQSCVVPKARKAGNGTLQYLAAYYVAESSAAPLSAAVIEDTLKQLLPGYMVPEAFVALEKFPLTVNGKLDKRSLPDPELLRDEAYVQPETALETQLCGIYASVLGLDSSRISTQQNFFKMGGNSILSIQLAYKLNQLPEFRHLNVADLFKYNTISKLIGSIAPGTVVDYQLQNNDVHPADHEIAIIGMSGAFSGAASVNELWQLIAGQQEGIRYFSEAECREAGLDASLIQDPAYIPVAGLVSGIELFDPLFWGLSPNEARLMDPQIRKFMEHCWYVLESAGYAKQRKQQHIGVFAGSGSSNYLREHILQGEMAGQVNEWEAYNANSKDALATKTAYLLGLTGPANAVNTACSTGLVAVVEACKNLQLGTCGMALAGGVSLYLPDEIGYVYQEGMIASKDGHCRTFDAEASGTTGGSGAGVVLLKRLKDAVRDKDNILAVIKGYASNNDGDRKTGYTAPSVTGQSECIINAQKMAGITADQVDYVECHGTATHLGDPIEVQALKEAFAFNSGKEEPKRKTVLGAIKANIGHTDSAAGTAGLIKVCAMLQHNILPGQVNYSTPNPELHLEQTPFEIISRNREWAKTAGRQRIAGVSSFGVGGTNAHVIIGDYHAGPSTVKEDAKSTVYVLPLSGKSKGAVERSRKALLRYLQQQDAVRISDLAYTLQERREHFRFREAYCAADLPGLITALSRENHCTEVPEGTNRLVFMFPGQGAQYSGMAKALYNGVPAFKAAVDACISLAKKYTDADLLQALYPQGEATYDLSETRWTQVSLFITEYALAVSLTALGLEAEAYIGHSIGEYVAATLSGVFRLEDAIKLVLERGRLMQQMQPGSMLAVGANEKSIANIIKAQGCELAVVNSSVDCVVSGTAAAIGNLKKLLDAEDIPSVVLATSHAYHSAMMEQAAAAFEKAFDGIEMHVPSRPFISNLSGEIAAAEVCTASYWCRQLREPVQFSKGIDRLARMFNHRVCFVEAGPGKGLSYFVGRQLKAADHKEIQTVQLLPSLREASTEAFPVLATEQALLARLWMAGICKTPNAPALFAHAALISTLPGYSFDQQRCWLEKRRQQLPAAELQLLPPEEWLSAPVWSAVAELESSEKESPLFGKALVFLRADQLMLPVLEHLAEQLQLVVLDTAAKSGIQKETAGTYRIHPANETHFEKTAEALKQQPYDAIVHLASLDNTIDTEEALHNSFYSLFLVKNYFLETTAATHLLVLTNGLAQITNEDRITALNGTLAGAVRTINHELQHLHACLVDIGTGQKNYAAAIKQAYNAGFAKSDQLLAFRFGKLWMERYDAVSIQEQPESRISDGDAVLVTGGLGGVALAVAAYLSERHRLQFILVGRKALQDPAKEQLLEQIRSRGSSVEIAYGDIADAAMVKALCSRIGKQYGNIAGIIHTAGVLPLEPEQYTLQAVKEAFRGKVYGLETLLAAIDVRLLKYIVCTSSLASVMGDVNRIEYCASNAYLDYLVADRLRWGSTRVITINWPGWQNVGMSAPAQQEQESGGAQGLQRLMQLNAVSPQEGAALLYRLMHQGSHRQVIISRLDRQKLLDRLFRPPAHAVTAAADITIAESGITEKEANVARIVAEVLGLDSISVQDDFFRIGGNSISAIQVSHRISKALDCDVKVADIFRHKTAAQIAAHSLGRAQARIGAAGGHSAVLSFAQERLWFIEQFEQGSNAYHIPVMYTLHAQVDMAAVTYALQQIIARHDVLRSTIGYGNEQQQALQQVHAAPLVMDEVRLDEATHREMIRRDINRPFDLAHEYPLRATLYDIAGAEGQSRRLLLINMHHIASDGWSLEVFKKEFFAYFNAFTRGDDAFSLPLPEIQYRDYAAWQRNYLSGAVLEKQLKYWKEKLSGCPALELPTDYPRPQTISYKGAYREFTLDTALSARLRGLAQQAGVTLHSVLLASVNILLGKYTGQQDIVIGSPTANRHHRQTEALIGFFVNMQAHRTLLDAQQSFLSLVTQVHAEQQEAQQHQDLPFEKLVDELGVERDPSRHPVFQVMFGLQNLGNPGQRPELQHDDFMPYQVEEVYEVEKFDLSVFIDDSRDTIIGQFSYAEALFSSDTIAQLSKHYIRLLERLAAEPETAYSRIGLLDDNEFDMIVHQWNATGRAYRHDTTIHQLFSGQAQRSPDATALVFEGTRLSYKALDERSNQLAHHIRARYLQRTGLAMPADTLIVLCVERSIEMMVGILAVLKAGGAYVPLDPSYPAERISYMLEDTRAEIILSQRHLTGGRVSLPAEKVVHIGLSEPLYREEAVTPLPLYSSPAGLAYVIYTSGTTGRPKGAMLNHTGIVNRLEWMQRMYPLAAADVVLQKTPYVFDVSVWEIFWAHWYGATIVLAKPEGHKDSDYLHQLIRDTNVSTLHFVPSMLDAYNQYLQSTGNRFHHSVRQLFCSGEALGRSTVQQAYAHAQPGAMKLHNLYGPTEASIDVTYYETAPDRDVYIGKPIDNTQVYILDASHNPVPVGVPGELYLGGIGLARGYLNRPELTAERFIAHPFATAADRAKGYNYLYKTGDQVKWLPDGTIVYMGRNDDQVKIRGYRIELGEIENALLKLGGIRQCCVLAREKKTEAGTIRYIAGYYVPDKTNVPEQAALLEQLALVLPEYMIPAALVAMDAFPVTINGKLDKRALPEPDFSAPAEAFVAPATEEEEKACAIWKEVLGLERIGTTDDFFRTGGNSILAIQVSHRMSAALGYDIKVADVFRYKSIGSLLANTAARADSGEKVRLVF